MSCLASTPLQATTPTNRSMSKFPYSQLRTTSINRRYTNTKSQSRTSTKMNSPNWLNDSPWRDDSGPDNVLECHQCSALISLPSCLFDLDKDGLLVRWSALDGSFQGVVLLALRERVISLSHEPLFKVIQVERRPIIRRVASFIGPSWSNIYRFTSNHANPVWKQKTTAKRSSKIQSSFPQPDLSNI